MDDPFLAVRAAPDDRPSNTLTTIVRCRGKPLRQRPHSAPLQIQLGIVAGIPETAISPPRGNRFLRLPAVWRSRAIPQLYPQPRAGTSIPPGLPRVARPFVWMPGSRFGSALRHEADGLMDMTLVIRAGESPAADPHSRPCIRPCVWEWHLHAWRMLFCQKGIERRPCDAPGSADLFPLEVARFERGDHIGFGYA